MMKFEWIINIRIKFSFMEIIYIKIYEVFFFTYLDFTEAL